ncbi:TetR/AcrR family transcriptional regulator [Corynebacterium auris]|uniref:TetR/AcrR family transcriptional regulator n=1 Tax=Corynebacterium auris TaxID=44750 RepID=UPI0025B45E7C|nr:TetR/AcrR family transcriptional regulator [Corynebacterium auris]WJY69090.1 Transcriptional regulator, TetR family [Corynebacterium auris]
MSPQRSRGRPTKAIVTCDKITKAALDIAAQQGYAKLTMSAVARALGVSPSALYNHVSGKEELLFIVEDAVMAQVDTAALEACLAGKIEPAEALTAWGVSYRDVLSRHCALIAHLGTMPTFGARGTVEMYELVVAVVRRRASMSARRWTSSRSSSPSSSARRSTCLSTPKIPTTSSTSACARCWRGSCDRLRPLAWCICDCR